MSKSVDHSSSLLGSLQDQIAAFPTLLTPGTDDTFHSIHSYRILQALSGHASQMQAIETEYAALQESEKTFYGQSSSDLANAFNRYATQHLDDPLSQKFAVPPSSSSMVNKVTALAASAGGSYATNALQGSTSVDTMLINDYSWATLLQSKQWTKIFCSVLWMCLGLTLLFFGYSSLFWLNALIPQRKRKDATKSILPSSPELERSKTGRKRSKRKRTTSILRGGVGGIIIGFLSFSYAVAVIHNSTCVNQDRKPLAVSVFFTIWLLSGLTGAIMCGQFALMARIMAAVLGATSLAIILTATFSLRLLMVRIILFSLFVTFFTVPMLQRQERVKQLQMYLLNACTSLIGIVTFLNGVALVSPRVHEVSAWLDLWTVLFMSNAYSGRSQIFSLWQSKAFKGMIAASILGSLLGFLFELVFHRHCGEDLEADWNQYLGQYTRRIESSVRPEDKPYDEADVKNINLNSRAGLFEPSPSAWQRMIDFFDSDGSRPAHYGNLSGDDAYNLDASQANHSTPLADKIDKKRSRRNFNTSHNRLARFSPLKKHDYDDDFDDASSADDEHDDNEIDEKH